MTTKKPLPLLDGDDPEAKLRFIKQYGPEAYETALRDWQQRNTMTTVNGYPIRRVNTRFGGMFVVNGTKHAFAGLPEAEAFARNLPTRH
jgi:hypothetical protein